MRIAASAAHFRAAHAETVVVQEPHVTLLIGVRKAGPSAVRLELRIRCEEFGAARAAVERSLAALVEKAAGKRCFGSCFTQDVVPLRAQFRLPLLLGFLHFGGHVVSHDIPRTPLAAFRMRPMAKEPIESEPAPTPPRWSVCRNHQNGSRTAHRRTEGSPRLRKPVAYRALRRGWNKYAR